MTTKEQILEAALCLFNQEGFEATSARQIARVVRISQGNLRYYFATKEVIAGQLFEVFYQEYREILQSLSEAEGPVSIDHLLTTYRQLFAHYYEYRFVFQDLWSVTRSLPGVKKVLQEDYRDRRVTFRAVLEGLVESGDLEKPEGTYLFDRIIYLQLFVGDCWMTHSGIYFQQELQEETRHYLEHWLMLLLPYLTVSGLEALMEYARSNSGLFFNEFNQLIQWHFDRKLDHEHFSN